MSYKAFILKSEQVFRVLHQAVSAIKYSWRVLSPAPFRVCGFFWKLNAHKNVLAFKTKNKNSWTTRISWIDLDPTSWSPWVLRGLVVNMRRTALHAGVRSHVPCLFSSYICISCILPFLSIHLSNCEWGQNVFSFYLPWGKMCSFFISLEGSLTQLWMTWEQCFFHQTGITRMSSWLLLWIACKNILL